MPPKNPPSTTTGPTAVQQKLDDDVFRASLAPHHDEHVRDRYWHAQCPQCQAEEASQIAAKTAKVRSRQSRSR
jgi:hypothetical protein